MQKYSFINSYTYAPKTIKDFIFSDDFNAIFDELVKKFELGDSQELSLNYLFQDLAVKFLEPAHTNELASVIREKALVKEELASNLAYLIWTRYKPLADKAWQEAATIQKQTREESFKDIIKQARLSETQSASNVVNLEKFARKKPFSQKPLITQIAEEEIQDNQLKPSVVDLGVANIDSPNIVNIKFKSSDSSIIKPTPQPISIPIQSDSASKLDQKNERAELSKTQLSGAKISNPDLEKMENAIEDAIEEHPDKEALMPPPASTQPAIPSQQPQNIPAQKPFQSKTPTQKPEATNLNTPKEKDILDFSNI